MMKTIIPIMILMALVSCRVQKSSKSDSESSFSATNQSFQKIETVSYTRPEIDWSFSNQIQYDNGIAVPVSRIIEKDGVKVIFGITEDNELTGQVIISGDTVSRKNMSSKSLNEAQRTESSSTEEETTWQVLGLRSIVFVIIVLVVLIWIVRKFKLYKLILPWS